MAPKGGKKKDPNAPTLVPEDSYVRARKLADLKVQMKVPKGDFTSEEWCIPPALHSLPELKQSIHFWQQCAIVQYSERDMKVPSRMKFVLDEGKTPKKPHPRKELMDLLKFLKTQAKQAAKRTGQFLKQLMKKEAKEMKREALLKQISDVDIQMNEELRSSRRFVEKQQLFDKRYMTGSKLGALAPRKNALIAIELSDRIVPWIDETKDEVVKLLNEVINNGETETFNVALFSGSNVVTWCPQFQSKVDPKKGLPDAIKWLGKNLSLKTCSAQPAPPDYLSLLNKFAGEGQTAAWRIFLCCARSPEVQRAEVVDRVVDLRETLEPPARDEPILPINVVAFDPAIVGDAEEKEFFDDLAGPNGSFMIDTSAEDLVALDKMLKAVQVKKKQLDKLHKKLDKMEDLSERVVEDRSLLQVQIALQRMLENDFAIVDWALKSDVQLPAPDI